MYVTADKMCYSGGATTCAAAALLTLLTLAAQQGAALRLPSIGLQLAARQHATAATRPAAAAAAAAADLPGALGAGGSVRLPHPGGFSNSDFTDGDDTTIRSHWALLVAGSAGWPNYRHQSDVCHAYQALVRGGLRPGRIVVMLYDDIAHDPENPFPGQIFNSPGGPDVYGGVRVDYRGADVSASTFLAVLEGNASAVRGVGSGRVLASGPLDRLFVFYSDHGAPGVLGMPSGPFLYADDLVGALTRKYRRRGYKEAVLYIEACESGSMFEGLLPPDIAAYVTTASSAVESSWGTYCPGMSPGPSPAFSTCLGDLYSVSWMENADFCDLTQETLMAQYDIVRNRTSNNYTYNMGSHVMQYGTLAITREVAGDYEGMHNRGAPDGVGPGDGPACQPRPLPPSITPLSPAAASEPSAVAAAARRLYGSGGGGGDASASPLAAAWAALRGAIGWMDAAARGGRAPLLYGRSGSGGSGRSSDSDSGGGSEDRGPAVQAGWQQPQPQPQPQLESHPHRPHLQGRSMEQREADLAPLRHKAAHGATREARAAAQASLDAELARRGGIDSAALGAATRLLAARPALAAALAAALQPQPAPADAAAAEAAAARQLLGSATDPGPLAQPPQQPALARLAHQLVYSPLGRPGPGLPPLAAPLQPDGSSSNNGALLLPAVTIPPREAGAARPLVDDWDCLRAMVAAWEAACGRPMDQYEMRHTRLLANLCNAGVAPAELREAMAGRGVRVKWGSCLRRDGGWV